MSQEDLGKQPSESSRVARQLAIRAEMDSAEVIARCIIVDTFNSLSTGTTATQEQQFYLKLPALIIKVLSTQNIPINRDTIKIAYKEIVDKVFIEDILRPIGLPDDCKYLIDFFSDAHQLLVDNAEAIHTKMVMLMDDEGLAAHHKRLQVLEIIRGPLVDALRNELKLSENSNNSDVLKKTNLVLARVVGQMIDNSFPEATADKNHAVWKGEILLSTIVNDVCDGIFDSCVEHAKAYQPTHTPVPKL